MSAQVQSVSLPADEPRARSLHLGFVPSMRQVKLSLALLAGSGLVLWEPLGLAWSIAAPVLVAHVVVGSLLVAGVIVPFVRLHRRRLRFSHRRQMRVTGRAIELSLLLLVASGIYLLLVGNRGALLDQIAAQLHLWLTPPLVALVVGHVLPWSRLASLRRARRVRPERSVA